MKEYYAINILEKIFEDCVRDDDKEYIEKNLAFAEAVKALSEIQQYRAIGTVEECRDAREKQIGKRPIRVTAGHNDSSTDGCPICKKAFYEKVNFCPRCGKAIDC